MRISLTGSSTGSWFGHSAQRDTVNEERLPDRLLFSELHRPNVALPIAESEIEIPRIDVQRKAVELAIRISEMKNSLLLVPVDRELPDG